MKTGERKGMGLRPAPRPAGPRERVSWPSFTAPSPVKRTVTTEPIDGRRPHRATGNDHSSNAGPWRLEASKLSPVNTNATRILGVTHRRDTWYGTPSGRGKRRAGTVTGPADGAGASAEDGAHGR